MLLKLNRKYRESAAALVELAITFPLALTIVLATVHLSDVMRESGVIIEAARHGARSVTAASGTPDAGGNPPTWIKTNSSQLFQNCGITAGSPPTPHQIANIATCDFMQEYLAGKWNQNDWQVASEIKSETEGSVTFWNVIVELRPVNPRGPVNFFLTFINLKPQSKAIFPLMHIGDGG